MNVELGTDAAHFLFWEYLNRIFLQCSHCEFVRKFTEIIPMVLYDVLFLPGLNHSWNQSWNRQLVASPVEEKWVNMQVWLQYNSLELTRWFRKLNFHTILYPSYPIYLIHIIKCIASFRQCHRYRRYTNISSNFKICWKLRVRNKIIKKTFITISWHLPFNESSRIDVLWFSMK